MLAGGNDAIVLPPLPRASVVGAEHVGVVGAAVDVMVARGSSMATRGLATLQYTDAVLAFLLGQGLARRAEIVGTDEAQSGREGALATDAQSP